MFRLTEAHAKIVAANAQTVLAELDQALATLLRMSANVTDGLQDSGVPAGQVQRILETLTGGAAKMLEARQAVAAGVGQLEIVRRRSTIAEVAIGCPSPWIARAALAPA